MAAAIPGLVYLLRVAYRTATTVAVATAQGRVAVAEDMDGAEAGVELAGNGVALMLVA